MRDRLWVSTHDRDLDGLIAARVARVMLGLPRSAAPVLPLGQQLHVDAARCVLPEAIGEGMLQVVEAETIAASWIGSIQEWAVPVIAHAQTACCTLSRKLSVCARRNHESA